MSPFTFQLSLAREVLGFAFPCLQSKSLRVVREMTRYFMTIPEAASLVQQSAAQGEGAEMFVLEMGSP